jgi:hypothetical protein
MATVYTQNWTAGNSLFTSMEHYDRVSDGVDSLYPEIESSEAVTVTGGRLDWNPLYGDYVSAGIDLKGFPALSAGNGEAGFVTCRYKPNATSLSENVYAPLIILLSSGSFAIDVTLDAYGAPFLYIYASDWNGTDWEPDVPYTFVADTEYVITLCWKCQSADGVEDGYIKLLINGEVVAEVTDFAWYFDSGAVDEVFFGYYGLLGALDQIEFNDEEFVEAGPPPLVNAGPDQIIQWPVDTVSLTGTATGVGTLSPAWSKTFGIGTVTASSPTSLLTTAEFSGPGTYVLRLTVEDDNGVAFDEMTVTVRDAITIGTDCTAESPGPSLCGQENVLTWIEQTTTLLE